MDASQLLTAIESGDLESRLVQLPTRSEIEILIDRQCVASLECGAMNPPTVVRSGNRVDVGSLSILCESDGDAELIAETMTGIVETGVLDLVQPDR